MKKYIIEDIKTFCNHISYLEDLFELERELMPIEDDNNLSCPDAINLINRALYDASFMTISKLIADKDRQTRSFWSLLEQIEDNAHLFDNKKDILTDKVRSIKDELGSSKSIVDKIKNRRDALIVHNDKKFFSHPEKYIERIPNYELWQISSKIKTFLDFLIEELGIETNTVGRYMKSQDFRRIVESDILKYKNG